MTGKERISNILSRKPVDRIGVYEHFWGDTYNRYLQQGHIKDGKSLEDSLNLDIRECWAFNLAVDLDLKHFQYEVIQETDDWVIAKDSNGATLKRHKLHDSTPEHIDFSIKCGDDWKEIRHMLANPDFRRINFEAYRESKKHAEQTDTFFVWSGVNVFECMHPVCGHEHMLVGMALEPEWITDMASVYADLLVNLMEELFDKEGYPDGIWFYEDMGFKERPFMSPAMYEELIMPSHTKTISFAHSKKLPVIMHSCGFVEPLLPKMVEAGIDCLQVIEIKAGMDLLRIHKNFGDRLSLMGGIDVRELYSNDLARVEAELAKKIPFVKQGYGYCLHSDHSIPETVDYDTLQYFINRGIELGTY